MSIKKINGYKIKMDAVLGHGAYGSVLVLNNLGLQRGAGWH